MRVHRVAKWALILSLAGIQSAFGQAIREIRVEGVDSGSPAEVRKLISVSLGEDISRQDVREDIRSDIRNIFTLPFVRDITVVTETMRGGVRLIYQIHENPGIEDIDFHGNRKFRDGTLASLLGFTKRVWIVREQRQTMFYSPHAAEEMRKKIAERYSEAGYPNTEITTQWALTSETQGRLTFIINEGRALRVERVVFEGAEHFTEKALRKTARTKRGWFIFHRKFKQDVFEEDFLRLQQIYREAGYLNASISRGTFQTTENGKGLIVVFRIEEGDQFFISDLSFTGNRVFSSGEITEEVKSATGEVANLVLLSEDVQRIMDKYKGQGYIRALVSTDMVQNQAEKTVSVTLRIREGMRVYLRNIILRGVTTVGEEDQEKVVEPVPLKTRDFVILREIKMESGAVLDWDQVREAERKLINTRFFEQDPYSREPALLYGFRTQRTEDDDIDDLVLTLEEAKTGMVQFGGGYSTAFGPSVFVGVSEQNLFGLGQRGSIRAELGSKRSTGRISWTEPHFLQSEYLLGLDLYYLDRKPYGSREFSEQRAGGSVRVGKSLSDELTATLRYRLEAVEIRGIVEKDAYITEKPRFYEDQDYLTSAIGLGFEWDTRDYFLFPTRGNNTLIFLEAAGLGGDVEFFRIEGDHAWFHRLAEKLVLAFNVKGGLLFPWGSTRDVPLQERYFLGGANSIRGFQESGIGPREPFTRVFMDSNGMPVLRDDGSIWYNTKYMNIGGESYTEAHTELRYRLTRNLDVVGFVDAGTVGEDPKDIFSDYRVSVGGGLRISLPIGAGATIRLDLGYPLVERKHDDTTIFHFSFGNQF